VRATRRALIASALAAPLPAIGAEPAPEGLGVLAAARGITFGSMITWPMLRDAAELRALLRADARAITPGLELKWAGLRPAPDRFDFTAADTLMEFAGAEGMEVYGHALVWHEALPGWFDLGTGAASARRIMQTHIGTVLRRYAGRIKAWDVVNEPINPTDNQGGGLRASPFLRALGPDYIPIFLQMAAEADPGAKLVINEFDLELRARDQEARRRAMLELLNGLVRRRVPIHALGIQAHVAPCSAPFDAELLRRFIRDVGSLGLEVYITELDMIDRLLPADIAARDAEVAGWYRDLLGAVLAEQAVKRVTLWGFSDRESWVNQNAFVRRRDGLPTRAHPYDDTFRRKPAWHAIAATLRAAPERA
jgi:endo-1,4-beta-xylanase